VIGLAPIPQVAIIELARSVVLHLSNPQLKRKQLQHQPRQQVIPIEQLNVVVLDQDHSELLEAHMSRNVVR